MRARLLFSWLIYTLAVINTVLASVFYYKLSDLSPEAYLASGHYAGFGFWGDYLTLLVIPIFLPVYLNYNRYDFGEEFGETFQVSHSSHKKIAATLFCDVLPLLILIATLIFCVRYWP